MSQTTVELITDGKIQTADLASDLQKAFVPLGGIIMWYGSVASVPDGFSLCNGTTVNGYATPNLQDRFVIGAGNSYAVNATGGSANATLVSHTHTADANGDHNHTIDAVGNHTHTYTRTSAPSGGQDQAGSGSGDAVNQSNTNTGSAGGHTHTLQNAGSHAHTISTEGSSATNANLPPYYALCYIMRTS